MVAAKGTDAEFKQLIEEHGVAEAARRLGSSSRSVHSRRRRLEERLGCRINVPDNPTAKPIDSHPHRIALTVPNGVVLVGGDAHIWPGPPSTAFRAFLAFIKRLKPVAVIANGDFFDGARISRHPPIGWAQTPSVKQEIEAVQERMHELVMACPKGCRRVWTLGNHDARFETRIATVAPEYAEVHGVSLQDHFPLWEPAWSCWINEDVVVKHRFTGGIYAPRNNTLRSGRTMVTGHLHSQKVMPHSDYNGTRYGVDAGCLADPDAAAFVDYTEDNPKDWRPGFCVLTFKDGELLMPELVTVWDSEHVQFRGELVNV
jgi:hypothetical protein